VNIDDIIPYERNARHNEKAIPVVAESIKTFGFKGAIVLRSREDPTIVNGHTRVAACKSLGWTEFPDEYIVYADDLTDDEVRALRLADNRTGEVATWNKALLKGEVKAIEKGGLDMSRFSFDFKSKQLPYGAERLKTDHAYNLQLVNASHCDSRGMPRVLPCCGVPEALLPFNYAKTATEEDRGKWLHFFIDDYQFERLWNSPERYLELIRGFAGVLSPDFSLYMDMPYPMQRWNEYRRRALANYWQRNGVDVIPTLSWTDSGSYTFCFDGLPKGSTVAVSTVGAVRGEESMRIWRAGMAEAVRRLEPSCVVLYGPEPEFDFKGAEVVRFAANTAFRK